MRLSRIQLFSNLRTLNLALLGLFIFCQVSGFMCMTPDVSLGGGYSLLPEITHACPMENSTTCPTSFTASPQRQTSPTAVAAFDPSGGIADLRFSQLDSSFLVSFPWSRASSLASFPIRSISVLRI